jgi:predicted aspartyl protease
MDTGADLTVISTSISEKLGIVPEMTEREWAASDGD